MRLDLGYYPPPPLFYGRNQSEVEEIRRIKAKKIAGISTTREENMLWEYSKAAFSFDDFNRVKRWVDLLCENANKIGYGSTDMGPEPGDIQGTGIIYQEDIDNLRRRITSLKNMAKNSGKQWRDIEMSDTMTLDQANAMEFDLDIAYDFLESFMPQYFRAGEPFAFAGLGVYASETEFAGDVPTRPTFRSIGYTGRTIVNSVPGYDGRKMVKVGEDRAKDVGKYNFIVKPVDGITWSDFSKDPVEFTWSIIPIYVNAIINPRSYPYKVKNGETIKISIFYEQEYPEPVPAQFIDVSVENPGVALVKVTRDGEISITGLAPGRSTNFNFGAGPDGINHTAGYYGIGSKIEVI